MLEPGVLAPEFTLRDQNGDKRFSAEFLGRPTVVLLFESVLTPQAQVWLGEFYWNLEELVCWDINLVAISGNFHTEILLWNHPLRRRITLLADPAGRTLTAYGALPLDLRRGDWGKVSNTAFLISPVGTIVEAWYYVRVVRHVQKVIAALEAMSQLRVKT